MLHSLIKTQKSHQVKANKIQIAAPYNKTKKSVLK